MMAFLLQIRGNLRAKREDVLGIVAEGVEKNFGEAPDSCRAQALELGSCLPSLQFPCSFPLQAIFAKLGGLLVASIEGPMQQKGLKSCSGNSGYCRRQVQGADEGGPRGGGAGRERGPPHRI